MKKEKLSFNELIHDPYYRDRDFIEFIDFKGFMKDVFPPYFFEEKNQSAYIEFCYSKNLNKDYLTFKKTKGYQTFDRLYNKARNKYKWDDSSNESFCDLDLKKIKHKKKRYSKKQVDFRLGGLSCSYYEMCRFLESLRIEEYELNKLKTMNTFTYKNYDVWYVEPDIISFTYGLTKPKIDYIYYLDRIKTTVFAESVDDITFDCTISNHKWYLMRTKKSYSFNQLVDDKSGHSIFNNKKEMMETGFFNRIDFVANFLKEKINN